MGKQIIRISRWSFRSAFKLYSKLMTLIFALFCAATGQLPKNTSAKRVEAAQTIFKGMAYRASDSTALVGIKLYLSDCFFPVYGIFPDYGIYPLNKPISPINDVDLSRLNKMGSSMATGDTIVTDENGNFEHNFNNSVSRMVAISTSPVTEPSGKTVYASSGCIQIIGGKDSTYTLYLRKVSTGVKQVTAASRPSVMTTYHGQTLQIMIPEWREKNGSASIINSLGQNVILLNSTSDGTFIWDTRTVVKGIYFFRAQDGQTHLNVRILVK